MARIGFPQALLDMLELPLMHFQVCGESLVDHIASVTVESGRKRVQ